ncbi:MAG: hypothetical protein RBG13Loki_1828 [Promethearchaeota archaeon CR_4]|nr:MAG: hypothetical protein RBG13Loki_1828 [Candidatus Lokiarchaeota archaeon CR_4]
MLKLYNLPSHLKSVETLGKFVDKLKQCWKKFPSLRFSIPEFHQRVQNVYDLIDQLVVKVEYLETPTPEDFRFVRDLIITVRRGIQSKYLLEECIQKKIARRTPQKYIQRTKNAKTLIQQMLKDTKKILEKCYEITLKLLSTNPVVPY